MIELKSYYAYSNQGPLLQVNEDKVEIDLVNKLYFLLDGFGGTSVGDMTVQSLVENVKLFYSKIGGDPDSTLPFTYNPKYLLEGNALINAMEYAHSLLWKDNAQKKINDRGGASAIIVAQSENLLIFGSTGNCLGLVCRRGEMREVSSPDNYSLLSKAEHRKEFASFPMSGFGLFSQLEYSIKELRPSKGDIILLMSDGVYNRVNYSEMRHIFSSSKDSLKEKALELIRINNEKGNLDNQSLVILEY